MISCLSVVLKDSPSVGNPFASNECMIAPLVLGGIIAGAGALASGVINAATASSTADKSVEAQKEANKANLQMNEQTNENNYRIAQEQNQMNYRMMNEQNEWNLAQWNRENEYNSPTAVATRLRAAGINPAAVFNSGAGVTPASSLTSAGSAPAVGATMQAGHVNPAYSEIQPSFDFLPQAIQAFQQNQMMQLDMEGKEIQNRSMALTYEFEMQAMKDRLLKVANEARKGSVEYNQAQRNLDLFNDVYEYNKQVLQGSARQSSLNADLLAERISESKLNQEAIKIANAYAPRMNDAQLSQYLATVSNLYSAARANDAAALNSAADASLKAVQEAGVKLDNKQKDAMRDELVRRAKYEADNAYHIADRSNAVNRYGEAVVRTVGVDAPRTEEKVRSRVKNILKRKLRNSRGGVR